MKACLAKYDKVNIELINTGNTYFMIFGAFAFIT